MSEGPHLWPLMTGFLTAWGRDSECPFTLVPFLWFTLIGVNVALTGESEKTGTDDFVPKTGGGNLAGGLPIAFSSDF